MDLLAASYQFTWKAAEARCATSCWKSSQRTAWSEGDAWLRWVGMSASHPQPTLRLTPDASTWIPSPIRRLERNVGDRLTETVG